ncbi:hypothetical protein KUTeg_000668 [Tegillarca granosa]|uniref:Oxidation resistance protein 1 n=1 Tax=Tegillarca granosa TaxID=220873 RepID=A0ABQ9G1L7_TEGGR|nr:hypothetical protein KUTeg_000668 [Tegillarca granosa]
MARDEVSSKPVVYHDKTCPLYRSWCASHSNLFEENDLPTSPTSGDKETSHDHNTTANSEISEAGSVCSCGASGELSNQMVTPSSPIKDIVTSDISEQANQNQELIPHDQKIDSHKQNMHSPVSENADSEFGEFECAEMPKPLTANMICSDKEFVSVNLVTKTSEPDESSGTEKLQSTASDNSIVESQSPDKARTSFFLNSPKSENSQPVSETCDTHEGDSQEICDIKQEPSGELRIGNIVYLPVEEDSKGQITLKAIDDTKSVLTKLSEGEIEERARSQSAPVDVPQEKASNRQSIGSFGSFSVSPHLNAFVNYATGFFKSNPDVKDISDVIPDTEVKSSSDNNEAVEKNGDKTSLYDKLHMTVHRHSKNGKSGDLMDLEVAVENAVKLADKPELFQSFDKLIPRPAQKFEDPPLYLCLKLGKPINREVSQTCPIEAYNKLKKKPEYWFSIPRDKVDHLYAFFVQWTPEIYGGDEDINLLKRGFVVLGDEEEDNSDEEKLEIMDEYFGTAALQKDWEIISKDEALKRKSVDVEESLIFPELIGTSKILEEHHIYTINRFMPARTIGYPWTLIYSTEKHGFSLKTMYRDMVGIDSPILLVVKDTMDNVFGAMTSCELKVSDHFYGTGESFLFTFYPEFQIFRWTGENNFFMKGNAESLSIGAGQGVFGLWFDGDLYHGRTNRCETYDNDLLTVSEDFVVKGLEAWAFVSDV